MQNYHLDSRERQKADQMAKDRMKQLKSRTFAEFVNNNIMRATAQVDSRPAVNPHLEGATIASFLKRVFVIEAVNIAPNGSIQSRMATVYTPDGQQIVKLLLCNKIILLLSE